MRVCGVIGLVHERHRDDLGAITAELLRTLEYRGYDSTGAAIQGPGEDVDLRKDVGAPSIMVKKLGIDRLGGSILCAQVRWATFGAVDQANAQPHVVRCKTYLYGAHNGNVTNCDALKLWLESEGHTVRSDNDGEMVVHTVEHFFAQRVNGELSPAARHAAMRAAIVDAGTRLKGSYAAVIVDPLTRTLWAIKKGSSLYFGVGGESGDRFAIASSDLSSVLKLTRAVVPMAEGELVEFDAAGYRLYRLEDGRPIERKPVRSKLRAQDTELKPPFKTFMEQEIHAQVETSRDVVSSFSGGSAVAKQLGAVLASLPEKDRAALTGAIDRLRDQTSDAAIRAELEALAKLPAAAALLQRVPENLRASVESGGADALRSSEKSLFADLFALARTPAERLLVRVLDASFEEADAVELGRAVEAFVSRVVRAIESGRRIIIVSCGTSFHAAKSAALFFNEVAGVEVLPVLPGEFRAQMSRCVRDGDVMIAVSQSGETKDLIDVINQVIASGRKVERIAIVNNVNSTLAQEKCDLVLPLRCGPEIAVAATKSFINQLTVFYCLALAVAEKTSPGPEVARRRVGLEDIPELIRRTLSETAAKIEEAAGFLFLAPSIHILATRMVGVAKEGALKIREVVLNHTEGFEASEFKHGPNTILGFNTVFGLAQVERLLREGVALSSEAAKQALYADYPLVYVTGPDQRDVDLTVSQINTHKIRGASTIIVAERDEALRGAAGKRPADNPDYRSVYIELPESGDPLLTVFSATVVLQSLALAMSSKKAAHLDALGFTDHGVHPDVPKNVSKSITVD